MQSSNWVVRHVKYIPRGGNVLDLACGAGRHTRYLLGEGFKVTCLDIDVTRITDLESHPDCRIQSANLEDGSPWPFDELFDGIVVTNYLHRPLFVNIAKSLATNGVLIYETFMMGNEQYGKPSNPNFLLKTDELRDVFGESLSITSFNQGYVADPRPAMLQQICARN